MNTSEDQRAKTLWPYVTAALSIISGAVLAGVAFLQVMSFDEVIQVIGYWNFIVTLAYIWLAIRLVLKHEVAYKSGITLSLGNVGFVMLQFMFWSYVSDIVGAMSDLEVAVFFTFVITDLVLYGGLYLCFRDLVPPLLPENVPESPLTSGMFAKPLGITADEYEQFKKTRNNFIAYMHTKCRGSIDINNQISNQYVDLTVKPFSSYISILAGGKSSHKKYLFLPKPSINQIKNAKGLIDYVIATSASEDVLHEATKGLMKVSVYSLSEQVRTGKQPSDFDNFSAENLDIKFERYKRKLKQKSVKKVLAKKKSSPPLSKDTIECPHCGEYAPLTAARCPYCDLDFYPPDDDSSNY